jgi:hypothetical protein
MSGGRHQSEPLVADRDLFAQRHGERAGDDDVGWMIEILDLGADGGEEQAAVAYRDVAGRTEGNGRRPPALVETNGPAD